MPPRKAEPFQLSALDVPLFGSRDDGQSEGVQLLVLPAADAHGGRFTGAQRRSHSTSPLRRTAVPVASSQEGEDELIVRGSPVLGLEGELW